MLELDAVILEQDVTERKELAWRIFLYEVLITGISTPYFGLFFVEFAIVQMNIVSSTQ